MTKQPNLFARAAGISAILAALWTFYDTIMVHHMAITADSGALIYLGTDYLIRLITVFLPGGLLVLAWAAITKLLQKRKADVGKPK